MTAGRGAHQLLEALATAALAVTLVAGSMFVWIGVPVGGLWLAGELTRSPEHFFLFSLCAIPTSMVVFGWLLYRLNSVYESLRADRRPAAPPRSAWLHSSSDEPRRTRGAGRRALIDTAMIASAWTALVLMAIWFFFFAELKLVSW